jgi:hypothetical protein
LRSAWDPASLPTWLTQDVFEEIAALARKRKNMRHSVTTSRFKMVRKQDSGYRPHPRHWEALAELVDVKHGL